VTGLAVVPGAPALALLAEGCAALTAAGVPTARLDAEWLLAGFTGVDRFRLHVAHLDVSADVVARYRAGIARRTRHEPLQHILGWQEFCGLRLSVGRAVLVPRVETEGLVEWALDLLPGGGTVCDVGTGSGCIALAIAAARPDACVIGLERYPTALEVAAANLRALGLTGRVALVASDLFGALRPLRPAIDLVVANPPYLPSPAISSLSAEVRDWEPREALDGGPDGMAVLRDIIAGAPAYLHPGGWLVMEIGEEQARPLAVFMAGHGFRDIQRRRDLAGIERYLAGRTERAGAEMPEAAPGSLAASGSPAAVGSPPAPASPSARAPLGACLNDRHSSAGSARATFLGGGSPGVRGPWGPGPLHGPETKKWPRDEGGQSPSPRS
jgi:release factor glutamine methyltransferase